MRADSGANADLRRGTWQILLSRCEVNVARFASRKHEAPTKISVIRVIRGEFIRAIPQLRFITGIH